MVSPDPPDGLVSHLEPMRRKAHQYTSPGKKPFSPARTHRRFQSLSRRTEPKSSRSAEQPRAPVVFVCVGVGEHAPDRVLSLVIGGQQPYAINAEGPLARAVIEATPAIKTEGIEAFAKALEKFSSIRLPDAMRKRYLDNDPVTVAAANNAMLAEGQVVTNLRAWEFPCPMSWGPATLTSSTRHVVRPTRFRTPSFSRLKNPATLEPICNMTLWSRPYFERYGQ